MRWLTEVTPISYSSCAPAAFSDQISGADLMHWEMQIRQMAMVVLMQYLLCLVLLIVFRTGMKDPHAKKKKNQVEEVQFQMTSLTLWDFSFFLKSLFWKLTSFFPNGRAWMAGSGLSNSEAPFERLTGKRNFPLMWADLRLQNSPVNSVSHHWTWHQKSLLAMLKHREELEIIT